MKRNLGKGEVESSNLSCSTTKPLDMFDIALGALDDDCAGLSVNDSGTVAGNWQDDFSRYLNRPLEERLDDRYADSTYLYRYFTLEGVLLYVGVSNQPAARHAAHLLNRWSDEADLLHLEMFPDQRLALIAECAAIEDEDPVHNFRIRWQERKWYPRFYWYRDLTGGEFIGERPTWFAIEDYGRIGAVVDRPAWATFRARSVPGGVGGMK